ncbi:uncharacterized protein LOC110850732 [Folsomia candida]|uniref:uncharacterized protein LOC110850732 n=1 Tax=Folsomia candida TaxID=158441 RepID=UPI000B908D11|nr:uncharacterized protein LOC110850732 [Folsomia candida]XP_021953954.1 uncharacterized protein LOC110850732 [Folsomia candida]XP_035708619.1 uncharacterized protein LOC110850732 [Folsomia candida]XP_035708620.1 uncharacterized protein LOC110850732 [Folsomia candida]
MKMGCCFSCKDDEDDQGNNTTERQQLLRDPIINATAVVDVPSCDLKNVNIIEGQPSRGQEDELAKILHETASAMIDVSGSGSHSLDQREFQERSRQYLSAIQALSPTLLKSPSLLLGDFPNPERQLGCALISQEDLVLMEWAMSEVEEALHSIRVEHDEDLVVPFGGSSSQLIMSSPTPSS